MIQAEKEAEREKERERERGNAKLHQTKLSGGLMKLNGNSH